MQDWDSSPFELDLSVRSIIEALTTYVFILDSDARILFCNHAADKAFGAKRDIAKMRLCGDVLHCINAFGDRDVCGTTDSCKDCVLRNGIIEAVIKQNSLSKECRMRLVLDEGEREFVFKATVAPFKSADRYLALVVLDDLSELFELRKLVPVCAWCKKVRSGEEYWCTVEDYIKKYNKTDVSHSICPDCTKRYFS